MQPWTLLLDLLVNLTSLLVLAKVTRLVKGALSLGYKLNILLLLETNPLSGSSSHSNKEEQPALIWLANFSLPSYFCLHFIGQSKSRDCFGAWGGEEDHHKFMAKPNSGGPGMYNPFTERARTYLEYFKIYHKTWFHFSHQPSKSSSREDFSQG